MELFSKVMFALALALGLFCASGALIGCGSEDPNPNLGDDAGTSDADSGETDAGTTCTTESCPTCGNNKCDSDENCDSCSLDCACAFGTVCENKACVKDAFAELKTVLPGTYEKEFNGNKSQTIPEVPAQVMPEEVGCKGLLVLFSPIILCIESDLSLSLCKDGESTGPLCATDLKNTTVKDGQISADCSVLAQFGQEIKAWCDALPAKAKCPTAGECGAGGVKAEFTINYPTKTVGPITHKKL
jgi:hypothetical protein